jgi:hypothetical protein
MNQTKKWLPGIKIRFKFLSNYPLLIGLLVLFFTSVLVSKVNSGFAGSKYDSSFYFKMYQYIKENKSLIPLDSYEVASSPIFVHFFGFCLFVFGTFYEQAISLTYIVMAIVSVIYFEKFIRDIANSYIKIILLTALCGSGYFVAPMLYPTSDTPSILFFTLSLYACLKSRNRKLLAVSIFGLVSARQSMGWVLVVFILWDLRTWWKTKGITLKSIAATYLLAGFSLIVTFIYFKFNLFPDMYIKVQPENAFPVPNFLSSMQIGISLLIFTLPFLFFDFNFLKTDVLEKIFASFIGLIAIFSFTFTQDMSIGEGLGYLSILSVNLKLDLFGIVFLSYAGFLSLLLLSQGSNRESKQFLYLFFVCFLTSSLVAPIPYLRYFQISIIFCLSLLFENFIHKLDRVKKWRLVLIFLWVNVINMVAISL